MVKTLLVIEIEVRIPAQPMILEANVEKIELNWSFYDKNLVTQAAGGEELALKLLKKNTVDCNQLQKLGWSLLVRDIQEQNFDENMKAIRNRQDVSRTSSLFWLYPFIDNDCLLNVDERLAAADFVN